VLSKVDDDEDELEENDVNTILYTALSSILLYIPYFTKSELSCTNCAQVTVT